MRSLWLALLCFPGTLLAVAPASVSGQVYRESHAVASLRTATEKTIVFRDDGRFEFLKLATVSFVASQFGGRVLLTNPPGDGTYVYRKIDSAVGEFELRFDNGAKPQTWRVTFTSASTGFAGKADFPDLTFTLADLASAQSAPAANFSLRGQVSENQPLIAGFVVPGNGIDGEIRTKAAGATTRDILIRVVGPSLGSMGVTGTCADPDFEIYAGTRLAEVWQYHYSDWSSIANGVGDLVPDAGSAAGFRHLFSYVGAFPLMENSKDAAAVIRLAPGAYTIVAHARSGDAGGQVLIEVYFLP